MSKLHSYIWDEDISPTKFEEGWTGVINEYDLKNNDWLSDLYENRRLWIPAFFRDEPMVGMLRTTSRSESENFFFNQFHKKGDTLCEFYLRFESAMEKQRHVNAKLNHESLQSLPSTDTPLKIEKDAAEIYTRAIFYEVQEEIKASCYDLIIDRLTEVDGLKTFIVKEKTGKRKIFEVKHNIFNNEVDCSCKKFVRIGIQCRHVFFAFHHGEVFNLPKHCVVVRWMKNAERMISTVNSSYASQYSNAMGTTNTTLNDIWFEFQSCISLAGLDKQKLELIKSHVMELKCKLCDNIEALPTCNKNDIIESLVGSHPVEDIVIQLPQESRNKGCGKRIMSGAEKSISERKKRMRMCKTCGILCNHDSRNCPSNKK